MSSIKQTIDEFGRDLSLKPVTKLSCGDYLARFKGLEYLKGIKSWVEISYLLEEEEEAAEKEEKKKVEAEILAAILAERKKLVEKGDYELEEGEEVE
jgi:hypothetical protein